MKKQVITTSFAKLHKAEACVERYKHLTKALGGITKYGYTKPINLLQILEHNGLDDFWWTLGTLPNNEVFRLMACDFAESTLHIFENKYPGDERPRKAIQAARDYALGNIDSAARSAAESAAESAAWSAARSADWSAAESAAESAAWSAARSAARSAAESAAWSAAESAARSAARSAAGSADGSAARSAEQEKQIQIINKYLK